MSAPTRIVLLRHGLTDWNADGRFQGRSDIALNEVGLAQAAAVAPAVAGLEPAALYSSPLQRARVTAEAVAAASGLHVLIDERLAEIDVGEWAGLTIPEATALDPAFGEALANGTDHRRSATGETGTEAGVRFATAVREIAAAHPGVTTVVVGHGMVIRMCVAHLLGWDYRASTTLVGMGNCARTTLIRRRDDWRLETYNVPAPL